MKRRASSSERRGIDAAREPGAVANCDPKEHRRRGEWQQKEEREECDESEDSHVVSPDVM
jgi:hypothetical protein